MLFRVLGTVGCSTGDASFVSIGARKQRSLLAVLILEANRVVSRATLVDAIWGDALPAHPESALQVVMSRLRTELGEYGRRIVADHGGYRLEVAPDEVDVALAEALLRDGRRSLAKGNPAAAAEMFERALQLWSGDALAELASLAHFADAAHRLGQLRIALIEARNDAYLGAGRHLELLADIDAWIVAEPLREHLRAQHVVALFRAGRQADALRACDEVRKALRDELGIDPSAEMQRLERRVLDQDSTLFARDAGFVTPIPAWTAEELPFVGRVDETDHLRNALATAAGGGVQLVVVEGEAGMGKSRLLLHFARSAARDAIVMPLHVDHLFDSTLHALARVIAEATLAISDDELRFIVDGLPDAPSDIDAIRSIADALVAGRPFDTMLDDADMLRGAAPWIAALSAKAPVVLIVDDIDAAGTSFFHVVWRLASLSMPKRVLIVAGARSPIEAASPSLARLVAACTSGGFAQRLTLTPLDQGDIDDLLGRMRISPRGMVVARLFELTAGHPLMLAEMLSSGSVERLDTEWPTNTRFGDVVRRRTAELGRPTADLLMAAALFESDFDLDVLAEAVGSSEATVSRLVDRAVDAHVLQPSTLHSFRFTHRLYRQVMLHGLGPERRADGHRRIARVLERRGNMPAALLAAHWAGASGPDADAKVAEYAITAGREAMALFEPNSAVRWFDIATARIDERARGTLLAELAVAQQFAGDPRGLETLRVAVQQALDDEDDELTLAIVRSSSPGWSTLPGVAGPETRRLLARALDIAEDDATRSRVTASLASDVALNEPAKAEPMIEAATQLARESGDRNALVECLLRRASMTISPQTLPKRRAAVQELMELADPFDVVTRYFASSLAALTAIQVAEPADADAAAAEADEIAAQYDIGPVRWSAGTRRAWRVALTGDLEKAEHLVRAAEAFGVDAGVAPAEHTGVLQLALLRWQQCRAGETVDDFRRHLDGLGRQLPGLRLVMARALAEHADGRDEARSIVSEFAAERFEALQFGPLWSTMLIVTAETAGMLGMPDVAAQVRDLLLPYTDQVAHAGMWVSGTIAYGAAAAAHACGDPRRDALLERAVAVSDRLGAPHLAARARGLAALDRTTG